MLEAMGHFHSTVSFFLSFFLSLFVSFFLSFFFFLCLFVCLFVSLFVCLFGCFFVSFFLCLFVSFFLSFFLLLLRLWFFEAAAGYSLASIETLSHAKSLRKHLFKTSICLPRFGVTTSNSSGKVAHSRAGCRPRPPWQWPHRLKKHHLKQHHLKQRWLRWGLSKSASELQSEQS